MQFRMEFGSLNFFFGQLCRFLQLCCLLLYVANDSTTHSNIDSSHKCSTGCPFAIYNDRFLYSSWSGMSLFVTPILFKSNVIELFQLGWVFGKSGGNT